MNSSAQAFLSARQVLLDHAGDYETARQQFQWPQIGDFNWALDYFDPMARGNEAPALQIVGDDGTLVRCSFQQMSQRSAQVANWLRGLGVRRGDHLLLMLGNVLPLWELMLAAMKLGVVIIPATELLTTDDLKDRLERGQVKHVVAASAQAHKFQTLAGDYLRINIGAPCEGWTPYEQSNQAPTAFSPDGPTRGSDPLLLYFTSGTTSKPKLVLHTHQSYPVGHLSTMFWIGLRPGDVHLNISSPGWAKHAWSCFFAPWNAGACIFIYNYARFNAASLLGVLQQHQVTSLCAPPTVWRMLIQEDLPAYRATLKLRELLGAGEPLNPEIIDRVHAAWGLTIRDGYGQTETTAQVGNSPGQAVKAGSMGRPLPGYHIALLDEDGKEADEGEVCLDLARRPLGLMVGYLDSAEKTSDAMRGGYYHTGDVAVRDAQGYITFLGRTDDLFKASDYRISPFELESFLLEHEAVAEAAVIPSPDPVRLGVPKAFVILRPEAQGDAALARKLFEFSRASLAPYKRLRRIQFVSELPKTISGKIRRNQLRADENRRPSAAEARLPGEFFEDDVLGLDRA
jgi:acetyl-CoA synthetase